MKPASWPSSSTVVPPGTCLIHGPFAGAVCPTCSTAAGPFRIRFNEPERVKPCPPDVVPFGNVPAGQVRP